MAAKSWPSKRVRLTLESVQAPVPTTTSRSLIGAVDGAAAADADDVFDVVFGEEFVGVDGDGGDAHAAAHHGDGEVFLAAGEAEHVADGVDLAEIFEEVFGDVFGAERVAGHEDGGGEVAGVGFDVGGLGAHRRVNVRCARYKV